MPFIISEQWEPPSQNYAVLGVLLRSFKYMSCWWFLSINTIYKSPRGSCRVLSKMAPKGTVATSILRTNCRTFAQDTGYQVQPTFKVKVCHAPTHSTRSGLCRQICGRGCWVATQDSEEGMYRMQGTHWCISPSNLLATHCLVPLPIAKQVRQLVRRLLGCSRHVPRDVLGCCACFPPALNLQFANCGEAAMHSSISSPCSGWGWLGTVSQTSKCPGIVLYRVA